MAPESERTLDTRGEGGCIFLKINLGRRMKKKNKYLRFLQDITRLPSLASKTQSGVQLRMRTCSYAEDATVGTAGRRSRAWSPEAVYVRGRKRERLPLEARADRSTRGARQPGGGDKCGLWNQPQILALPPTHGDTLGAIFHGPLPQFPHL